MDSALPAESSAPSVEAVSSPETIDDSSDDVMITNIPNALPPESPCSCLSYSQFQVLCAFRPPAAFITLLCLLPTSGLIDSLSPLVAAEIFCGRGNLSAAFERQFPGQVCGFDIKRDPHAQDTLSSAGFVNALIIVFRLAKSGANKALCWLGTECSNYIWLSRSKTSRTRSNPPGDRLVFRVARANAMVARATILQVLCSVLYIIHVLEQPESSLMSLMPCSRWQRHVTAKVCGNMYETTTYLSWFGHACLKGSRFWSSHEFILGVHRRHPGTVAAAKLAKVVNKCGSAVTGKPSQVKDTQVYPVEFANKILSLWPARNVVSSRQINSRFMYKGRFSKAVWDDLDLSDVLTYMRDR